MMDLGSDFQVGTLRARTTGPSPPSVRLSVTRVLEVADVTPPGLARREVLIVRHLEDPLPGAFAARSESAANGEWERALRSRLELLYRGAVRPRDGRIAGDCEAVVFANRAELLACLVRDLVQGVAWQQWWWRVLLARWPAGVVPAQAVVELLADEPERMPAVFAQLHASADSGRVLNAVSATDALALVRVLAVRFGLAVVAGALSPAASAVGPDGEAAPAGREPERVAGQRSVPNRPQPDSKARRVRPDSGGPEPARRAPAAYAGATAESAPRIADPMFAEMRGAGLAREQEFLLGLALALAHRPWAVRAESFQRAILHRWWHAAHVPDESGRSVHTPDRRSLVAKAATSTKQAGAPPGSAVAVIDARNDPLSASASGVARSPRPPAEAVRSGHGTAGTPAAANKPAGRRVRSRMGDTARDPAGTVTTSPELNRRSVGPAPADAVTSEFAGVLYLLNLMTALDLPDCFEDDWQLASRLGPWALLEALGRAVLEAAAVDATTDPLWPWLAALDGRSPREPLGRELAVPPAFRLPRAWIGRGDVSGDTYYMAQARGRLRLWTDDYLLAEVSRDSQAPAAQAARELERFGSVAPRHLRRAPWRTAPLAHLRLATVGPALRQFMAFVLPFLQHRLVLALGAPAAGPASFAALLRCRARLHASPTHIDLVAPLDDISLPARLAGLDRDPGWQPSLGRVVSFHFE